MKRFMISLAIAGIAMVSFAQETVSEVVVPTKKHSVMTNGFWDNWFISVNGGINIYNGVVTGGESPFQHLTPSITAYFGKWHTPGYGWRVVYNGWSIKALKGENSNSFMNFHVDGMMNLNNLFGGYNPERVWNIIPYIGVGWAGTTVVEGSNFYHGSLSANYGLLNTFRLTDNWAINLEASGAFFRNGFAGHPGHQGHDMMWGLTAGITYKFNNATWENTPDIDAIMAMNAAVLAELNAQLQAKESENAQLKSQLAAAKAALAKAHDKINYLESEPRFVDVAQSVFFGFNSSKIASKKEIINLKSFVDAANKVGAKLSVVGYADSATGSSVYNQKLSERRAQAVAAELVKLGVAESQIVVEGKGGVAAENPASLNRRVIITIVK